MNEFLIAPRSTVPRSSNRNKSASEYTLFKKWQNYTYFFITRLNPHHSVNMTSDDTRNERKTLKARQAGTEKLLGEF